MGLIDTELGCWREAFVQETLLPCDAELILGMSLCTSWPEDKLVWHFSPKGLFTVRSTCYAIINERQSQQGSSSSMQPDLEIRHPSTDLIV